MIIAQTALLWCPDGVLVLLVLTEVTIRELQQKLPEGIAKKSLKSPCKIKRVLFLLCVN